MKHQLIAGIFYLLFFISSVHSQTLFKSDCQSLAQWKFLDMNGDGRVRIAEDLTVPPGYGPDVIEMIGTNVLLFAGDQQIDDATFLVLWKDVEPNRRDSDGILLFRADFPTDLTELKNLKQSRAQYWLEQDYDSGILIRYRDENDEELTLVERPGIGVVYDTRWNQTGWFWQKIQCKGQEIRAKFWSVVEPEPQNWILQTKHNARLEGRFGVRAWSGHARIAYYEASTEDVFAVVPPAYLASNRSLVFENQNVIFKLFTHLQKTDEISMLKLSVDLGEKRLTEAAYPFKIEPGYQITNIPLQSDDTQSTANKPRFQFSKQQDEGRFRFNVQLNSAGGEVVAEASRSIEFKSSGKIKKRMDELLSAQQQLEQQNKRSPSPDKNWLPREVAAKTAEMMAGLATERLEDCDPEGAMHALDLAEKALKRQNSYPFAYYYTPEFKLKFTDVTLSSESIRKGATDTVTVFWQASGKTPDRELIATLSLVDETNRVIVSQSVPLQIPGKAKSNGRIQQKFALKLPQAYFEPPRKPIGMPGIFTGSHYLTMRISARRKDDNSKDAVLLLDNPERQPFFRVGQHYLLREVHISSSDVQIERIELPRFQINQPGMIRVTLHNYHLYPQMAQCALSIQTAAGTVLHEAVESVKAGGGNTISCDFGWNANYAGDLKCVVKVIQNNQISTRATREFPIAFPDDIQISVARGNHVDVEGDDYSVPLTVQIEKKSALSPGSKLELKVYADDSEYAAETRTLSSGTGVERWQMGVWPHWGYYRVKGTLTTGKREFNFEKQLVATVVETKGMQILVNGEPFIVKGVNVHSMYSQSPKLTDDAMKILKTHGFNVLRGDYPPRWEVEMAHQNNLAWMLLAEFSCTSTDTIYARYEKDAYGAVQEIVRQYVLANCESAGALLWNSCNEIDDELDEFLINLYPPFKIYDPYQRPVNYANLYGQDNWHGQDIMGVNYYFGADQRALSRMPIIELSILVARKHNLPIIFTEYNSWWGPVERSGAEAVEILWDKNLNKGMAGGTLYKMTDVEGKHPGLIDERAQLRIRQDMSQALIRFHADAEITVQERQGRQVTLLIKNKRDFHLRQIAFNVKYRGVEKDFQLGADIPPNASINTAMLISPELANESFSIAGYITFETHFGLKSKIPIDLYIK